MKLAVLLGLALLAPSLCAARDCTTKEKKQGKCRSEEYRTRHLVPSNSRGASGMGGLQAGGPSGAAFGQVGGAPAQAPSAAPPLQAPAAAPSAAAPPAEGQADKSDCPRGSRVVRTSHGARCLAGR
jgi:hypothetical protein